MVATDVFCWQPDSFLPDTNPKKNGAAGIIQLGQYCSEDISVETNMKWKNLMFNTCMYTDYTTEYIYIYNYIYIHCICISLCAKSICSSMMSISKGIIDIQTKSEIGIHQHQVQGLLQITHTLWWTFTFCHGKIHHAINGKIHYFYGHFPWQNVSSPEGIK